MKQIFAFAILSALMISCGKEETQAPVAAGSTNTTDMEIELRNPENGTSLDSGAMIDFEVYITDKLSLHEYAVRLNTDSLQLDEEGHTHSWEKEVSMEWLNNQIKGDTIHLQVVSTNHKGELLEKDYWFLSR